MASFRRIDSQPNRRPAPRVARGSANTSPRRTAPVASVGNKRQKSVKDSVLTVIFSGFIGFLFAARNLFGRIIGFVLGLDKKAKAAVAAAAGIVCVVVVAAVVLAALTKSNAYEVYLGGELVGIVKIDSKKAVSEASLTDTVRQSLENEVGSKVQLLDAVTLVEGRNSDFVTLDTVVSSIAGKVNYRVESAVVYVNAEQRAILPTQEEAERLLAEIQDAYNQDGLGISEIGFVEEVQVVMEYVDRSFRVNYEQALALLTATEPVDDYYVIKSGENLTSIRSIFGMSEGDILAKNPGLDKDKLQPGQMLVVTKHNPLLSVKTVALVTTPRQIEYSTEYIDAPSYPTTHTKVISQGKDGQEDVTERITRVNGIETQREIVNRVTTVHPSNEIIEKGTKK